VSPEARLTEQERKIIDRIRLGYSDGEIEADLEISHSTLKNHIRNAMRALGARSRAHMVALVLTK
jgi:DNA-binding NarL/FixJ family response regulator